jgi:isopentenyl diphosphate isomerase/L-lactate dehydrogenase-like FMN-dependent dehydrogenase
MVDALTNRRNFLRFVAASPLFAGTPALARVAADPMAWAPRELDKLITDPKQALDVFDFEPVMHEKVPPAHFGYMTTGIDDEVTLRANRAGFQEFQLLPRRLIDVSKIDMRTEILGTIFDSPIFVCPTASNKAYHPEGEIAVAKAARAGNHLEMLSTVATTSIEDAIAARGGPVWYQLYPTSKWEIAVALAKRAERAGCQTIVITVDLLAQQNWETLARLRRVDTRQCSDCHGTTLQSYLARKPNFDGIDLTGAGFNAISFTWDSVRRLREMVKTKIVIKGILATEDAKRAAEAGIDAIVLSNHGGRNDDNGRSTIDALPGIVEAAGRMPVLIDSGFRRGTDIVKALALGATAVGVGRPYLWGLGAFGQPGVERVLEILRRETHAVMQQMGAPTVKDLVPSMVRRA